MRLWEFSGGLKVHKRRRKVCQVSLGEAPHGARQMRFGRPELNGWPDDLDVPDQFPRRSGEPKGEIHNARSG